MIAQNEKGTEQPDDKHEKTFKRAILLLIKGE